VPRTPVDLAASTEGEAADSRSAPTGAPAAASSTVEASALDIRSATTMAKSANVTIGSTADLIDLQYLDWLGDGGYRE
jgi:hypothetical protein